MKKLALLASLSIIYLTLNVVSVSASPLIPVVLDWEEYCLTATGARTERGLLEEFARMERSAQAGRATAIPYCLTARNGSLKVKSDARFVRLSWPARIGGQYLGLKLSLNQIDVNCVSRTDSARFELYCRETSDAVTISHRIEPLRFGWGVDLRWSHISTATTYEPTYEISWGAEAGTRFKVRISRKEDRAKWVWRLGSDSLAGDVHSKIESETYEIHFGEMFGVRMTAFFSEEQWDEAKPGAARSLLLSTTGERKTVGLSAHRPPPKKPGWRALAKRSDITGVMFLTGPSQTIGEDEDYRQNAAALIGGLDGTIGGDIRWSCDGGYFRRAGTMLGWMSDELPDAFQQAVAGGRSFSAAGRIEGMYAAGNARSEWRAFRLGAAIGFVKTDAHFRILDRLNHGGVRVTRLPLSGFSAGWIKVEAERRLGRLSPNLMISQAVILEHRGVDPEFLGGGHKLSGGWVAAAGIKYEL